MSTLLTMMMASCGPAAGSSSVVAPSAELHQTISVDGLQRTYTLFRPAPPSGAKVPLVIALHELGATGDDMAGTSGYDKQALKSHFIMAYPDGVEGSWNAGNCCGPAKDRGIDDVKFMRLLIDQVVSQQPVDRSRIFVTGFSNGAAMTYRLACELSDRIRAIASVSGAMGIDSCHPVRPVSVLEIHGSKDYAFPVEGTTSGIPVPALAAEMQQWAGLDGCGATPTEGGSAAVKISTWQSCGSHAVVKLELLDGGSHIWFARATSETWQFFSAQ
jgi:polyhydroxybutyrate depolymerase